MPIQEDFRDFLLRRAHYVQRLENNTIRDMVLPYRTAKYEIDNKLRSLMELPIDPSDTAKQWRINQLRNRLSDVNGILETAALESAGKLESTLADFAYLEAETYEAMLASKFSTVGIGINQIPLRQVDWIIENPMIRQYRDMSIGEYTLWNNKEAVDGIRRELTQSIIQGEDMARAIRRVEGIGKFGIADSIIAREVVKKSKMIARSEIQHVSNEVARGIYRENTDVLKGAMYTATLDSRTCMQCAPLDGKIYYYREGVGDHNGPRCPIHVFCRCFYAPVTYSWQELSKRHGVPFNNTQKSYFTGKTLETKTYSQWFNELGKTAEGITMQKDILGPVRYKLWSQGKLELKQMANTKRRFSMKDLKDKKII